MDILHFIIYFLVFSIYLLSLFTARTHCPTRLVALHESWQQGRRRRRRCSRSRALPSRSPSIFLGACLRTQKCVSAHATCLENWDCNAFLGIDFCSRLFLVSCLRTEVNMCEFRMCYWMDSLSFETISQFGSSICSSKRCEPRGRIVIVSRTVQHSWKSGMSWMKQQNSFG
jgi:hypothetical protein